MSIAANPWSNDQSALSITDIFACCVGALNSSTLFQRINIWLLMMRFLCQFRSSTNCLPFWLIVAKFVLLCLLSSHSCASTDKKMPQTIRASVYTPSPQTDNARLNGPLFRKGFPYPRASTCGSWGQSACWSRDHREDIVAARLHCWEVKMMVVEMLVVVVMLVVIMIVMVIYIKMKCLSVCL